ncbi:MAG: hypothetical protein FH758_03975 [Firmicutes bacterium]|nr:hypothetical protein [Bacillota bacterium]
MKKIVSVFLLAMLLTGCNNNTPLPPKKDNGPINVVNKYIRSSSQGDWDMVLTLLAGEALQQTRANKDQVKNTQQIISTDINTGLQTDNFAIVNSQVISTKNYGDLTYNDIASYKFRLKKNTGQWFIYKVEGQRVKPPLLHNNGAIPRAAKKKLSEYIKLPLVQKREKDYQYLAGQALQDSLEYKGNTPKEQPKTNVLDIDLLGSSDNYLILKATYSVEIAGYKPVTMTAIVDMVDLAGEWKIIRLDIAQAASE